MKSIADADSGDLAKFIGVSSLKPFINKDLVLAELLEFSMSYKEARGSLDEDRASPGEHLKRGHIQMYHTKEGPVNLWKQSITVAAGSPHAIKKSYKVKRSV